MRGLRPHPRVGNAVNAPAGLDRDEDVGPVHLDDALADAFDAHERFGAYRRCRCAARSATIASARAGPTPVSSVANLAASAVLILTGPGGGGESAAGERQRVADPKGSLISSSVLLWWKERPC